MNAAYGLHGAFVLGLIAAIVWLWRQKSVDLKIRISGLIAASVLITPYALDYDLMALAPAIAWWSCAAIAAGIHAAAIIAEPFPAIDVLDHLRRAGDVLWTGANPYASPVPDFWAGQSIYGFDTPGFPYPPVVLSVAALGRGLGLDLRWLLLGAALATSALTRAVALRSGWSREVAALLGILALSVPRQSDLIVSGFSEPLSGLLLTAALWLWLARRRAACFAALGLFVTSKQYLLVAAPLLALACASVSELLWLAGGAVVLWLPFAAWGPAALWNAAFGIHLSRPPRADGLTLSAFRMARGGDALAPWVPLLSGSAVAVLAGLPRPATPASLCLGLAGVLTLTLFLSPQAFSNYYLLTSWVLIAAIACLPTGGEGGREV